MNRQELLQPARTGLGNTALNCVQDLTIRVSDTTITHYKYINVEPYAYKHECKGKGGSLKILMSFYAAFYIIIYISSFSLRPI